MLDTFETILLTKEEGIARILLNRPRVVNAYNLQMRDELWQALEAVRDDPEVRVVLLSGAGDQGFCAGADLTEFDTAPSQAIARKVRFERGVWEQWLSIPKPFVGALHGYVLGSGVEMALLCDLRVAAEGTVFGLPEVTLGMIPAAGGTQMAPRQFGIAPALEMLLASRRLDVREAARLGLVHQVVPQEKLVEASESLAQQLRDTNPLAVMLVRQAVRCGMDLSLEEALGMEERLALRALMASGMGEGQGSSYR